MLRNVRTVSVIEATCTLQDSEEAQTGTVTSGGGMQTISVPVIKLRIQKIGRHRQHDETV